MKLLLIFGICLLALTANSQTTNEKLQYKQLDPNLKNYRGNAWPKVMLTDSLTSRFNRNYLIGKKKPGVYRLKDGMPCVVPDTKDIASIPNAWKGSVKTPYKVKPPVIPNPSKPDSQFETK